MSFNHVLNVVEIIFLLRSALDLFIAQNLQFFSNWNEWNFYKNFEVFIRYSSEWLTNQNYRHVVSFRITWCTRSSQIYKMYILQIYNGLQFLHQNHIKMTSLWRHFTRFTAVSCAALPLPRRVISSLVLVESFQILSLYSGNRLMLPLALLLLAAVERVVVLFENWNYYPLLVCVLSLDQNHIQS